MTAKSNWAENATLDWLLGGANPTRPTTRYIAFHTGDPGETGGSNELSTGGYARQAMTFGAASSGTALNSSTVDIAPSGAAWNNVSHFSLWDHVSAGNCLYKGAVTTTRSYADGEHLTVAAGAISVSED